MPTSLVPDRPLSPQAERTTLGALLMDPDRIVDVAPVLQPEDFYDPAYRLIYQTIRNLYEERKPIDYVTVSEALRGNAKIEALGGSAFLSTLAGYVPTSAHAGHYASIVRDKAIHRKVLELAEHIGEMARDESLTADEVIERSEQGLFSIARNTGDHKPQHIADIGEASFDRYARMHEAEDKTPFFGLTTGFRDLDQMLTGLQPGSLTIIAARPSVGKTSLALDIARFAAAKQGKNVTFLSLEMNKQELMDRTVAGYLGVDGWKLKRGELSQQDFDRMGLLFDQMRNHPLYIDDDANASLTNIRRKARRQQMEKGLDLLIIDYLQLITVTDRIAGENRTQLVTHISQSLKNLARELGVPVIALSQLSRSTEQRNPPIPILSDLRDSGGIEQDADVVLMLYREEMHNDDCENPGETDVYVRKNRNGATGRVTLFYDKAKMSFVDRRR